MLKGRATMANTGEKYLISKAHRFYRVTASIVEKEINPGVTVTFSSDVDLTDMETIRSKFLKGERPSYTAFVVKAMAVALQEFPYANRRIIRKGIIPFWVTRLQQFTSCDIAVACEMNVEGIEVATFIDIIRNVEDLDLVEITEWLRKLSKSDETTNSQWKAFWNAIRSMPVWLSSLIIIQLPLRSPLFWSKWRGGAVLVSSPAKYGVDSLNGSWAHPLGVSFGKVKQKPVAHNGKLEIRSQFTFSLNFDRRVMAGAQSARFFNRIVTILENPSIELALFVPNSSR